MCVVQAVPFARSVPGGSRNDGRGAGERTGSRYMSQQTSMNKTSRAEHSQKYGRVATRTKGREKKARYLKKERTNETFYKLIAFTHGTQIRYLVSDALHQVRGGAVWQFVSATKVRAPVFFYAVQYYTKHAARLQHAQAPPASMPTTHFKNAARQHSNPSKMWYFRPARLWFRSHHAVYVCL